MAAQDGRNVYSYVLSMKTVLRVKKQNIFYYTSSAAVSNPSLRLFCVKFACFPWVWLGFLWDLQLPATDQNALKKNNKIKQL